MNAIQSFSRTRQLLLLGIKRRGSAHIVELSTDACLSQAAARRQLNDLATEGYVAIANVIDGPGRPRCNYSLTGKGESVFPRHYRWIADAALEAVKAEGPEAAARVYRRMVEMNIGPGIQRWSGKPDRERLDELFRILDEQGFFPVFEALPDGSFAIGLRNCPLDGLFQNHPELCQFEMDCVANVFRHASVDLKETRRRGDSTCRFRIELAGQS